MEGLLALERKNLADIVAPSKTAAQIYARFRTVLRFSDGELWRNIHPFRAGGQPAGLAVEAAILRTLYQGLFLLRSPTGEIFTVCRR